MQTTQDVVILADPSSTRYYGVRMLLWQDGRDVVVIKSLHELLRYLSEKAPLAVIVAHDYRIGGGGWVVAEQVGELQPALPVLLVAHGESGVENSAVGERHRVLIWPFSREVLRSALGAVDEGANTLEECA